MEHLEFIKLVESGIDKLEAQGSFSRACHTDKCYYLNNGNCCIVGHMMPDDETRRLADNWDNGTGITNLAGDGFEWTRQFTPEQIDLLSVLQSYHDCGQHIDSTIHNMREYLETIRHG